MTEHIVLKPRNKAEVPLCRLDITDQVAFGLNDAEYLPIERCACGESFGHWDFFIGADPRDSSDCPKCGRKMWFDISIRVYQEVVWQDTD